MEHHAKVLVSFRRMVQAVVHHVGNAPRRWPQRVLLVRKRKEIQALPPGRRHPSRNSHPTHHARWPTRDDGTHEQTHGEKERAREEEVTARASGFCPVMHVEPPRGGSIGSSAGLGGSTTALFRRICRPLCSSVQSVDAKGRGDRACAPAHGPLPLRSCLSWPKPPLRTHPVSALVPAPRRYPVETPARRTASCC